MFEFTMWTKIKTTRNCAMFCLRDQTAQAVVEGDEADRFDQYQTRKPIYLSITLFNFNSYFSCTYSTL